MRIEILKFEMTETVRIFLNVGGTFQNKQVILERI